MPPNSDEMRCHRQLVTVLKNRKQSNLPSFPAAPAALNLFYFFPLKNKKINNKKNNNIAPILLVNYWAHFFLSFFCYSNFCLSPAGPQGGKLLLFSRCRCSGHCLTLQSLTGPGPPPPSFLLIRCKWLCVCIRSFLLPRAALVDLKTFGVTDAVCSRSRPNYKNFSFLVFSTWFIQSFFFFFTMWWIVVIEFYLCSSCIVQCFVCCDNLTRASRVVFFVWLMSKDVAWCSIVSLRSSERTTTI